MSCVIIKKLLRLICASSPKVYRIFYDFSVYLLEVSELKIIMISPLDNGLAGITLSISRYLLMEEIKE